MAAPSNRVDRRMQRTRQILQRAFIEVAHEKGVVATTIQDITERADVNRGTFYLHFADKYALLEAIIHEHFQHLLTSTLSGDCPRFGLPPSEARSRRSSPAAHRARSPMLAQLLNSETVLRCLLWRPDAKILVLLHQFHVGM